MWEAAALVLIVAGLMFWVDSLRARERALAAGRAACERSGLQFLDETVSGASTRLARGDDGQFGISRVFVFEFSDTGNNRLRGSITLIGAQVQDVYTEPYAIQ
ncbi:MAG: DUF3301 domain-containing protein [Burkholderiales bacterium]